MITIYFNMYFHIVVLIDIVKVILVVGLILYVFFIRNIIIFMILFYYKYK